MLNEQHLMMLRQLTMRRSVPCLKRLDLKSNGTVFSLVSDTHILTLELETNTSILAVLGETSVDLNVNGIKSERATVLSADTHETPFRIKLKLGYNNHEFNLIIKSCLRTEI